MGGDGGTFTEKGWQAKGSRLLQSTANESRELLDSMVSLSLSPSRLKEGDADTIDAMLGSEEWVESGGQLAVMSQSRAI